MKKNRWTDEEKEYIKQNAGTMKDSVIQLHLEQVFGRKISLQSVRKQRQQLGIFKASGRGFCKVQPPKETVVGV